MAVPGMNWISPVAPEPARLTWLAEKLSPVSHAMHDIKSSGAVSGIPRAVVMTFTLDTKPGVCLADQATALQYLNSSGVILATGLSVPST